ncbi:MULTISPECIES: N-acetyltransferase [unclassified Streptomyces]|uniref:GNAT family N-acetyltransferase n=1 Tax=unclassified Streptomyces TaxID=2593676 RepID=UPI00224EC62B|nr:MULTISPECIES: GNAT family N-acetyltransferase [unclassified Streptomyces]MCX5140802.1 GNAT family N-acetyltransferase [Streptomyces sp. NBC_00338]WRZ65323.1 GNAT family N-acetyltransferase [Streptomyces sp. NBC_01257]WSU59323.1 GNAT family N-acetyltransferase [Streptomyces sp. NBC_01104]
MFRLETEVDKERRQLLNRRLRDDNTARSARIRALRDTPAAHEVPLEVWALDAEGNLAAGLSGRTWAYWLHVDVLWVDARHRGHGLGSRLLAEAERVAGRDRSCTRSRVETWDFQAPDFYRKQGYEERGRVEDYPPGVTEFTFTKELG